MSLTASEILFHTEPGGVFPYIEQQPAIRRWVQSVISERGGQLGPINYVFCGDAYLHAMNLKYLNHDTLTDIITFPFGDYPLVSGDLFISTERVADNATDLRVDLQDELHRVMIHGILHLCGQGDKTEVEADEMRSLEDWALGLRPAALL